jgi:hypothetical protein
VRGKRAVTCGARRSRRGGWPRVGLLLVVGLGCMGVQPGLAGAVTTIGETTDSPLFCGAEEVTRVRYQHTTQFPSPSYAVPAGGGVITSWTTNPGANTGVSTRLEVIREAAGGATPHTVVAESALQTNIPAHNTTAFSTSIPVQAGDLIGLEIESPGGGFCVGQGPDFFQDQTVASTDPGPGKELPQIVAQTSWLMDVSATVESPKATTLSTSLSGEGKSGEKITVKEGTAVTDQATLSGENARTATGTFTYKVYSDTACTKLVAEAGTRNLEAINASEAKTFTAGTYYWQASYSGDERNAGSESKCGDEVETVEKAEKGAGTCGKTTIGKSSEALLSNLKRVNRCVLPANATVSRLTVYLGHTSTKGQQLIKGIIYADSSGKPGALLGTSSQLTFTSENASGWYPLAFATPLKLAAGTYWIGIITGGNAKVGLERFDKVTNAQDVNTNSYPAGPSNPFGSFKTNSEQMSLYATYTAESTCSSAFVAC